jgi:NADH-quinone oxidoreductase subunit C
VSNIDNNTIRDWMTERYTESVKSIEESYGMLDIFVKSESAKSIIIALKGDPKFEFTFLTSLCGIHFPDKIGEELDVVYHLHSLVNNSRVRIHATLPLSDPNIATITDVFAGANWMERETFEFYGIIFVGHPDLRIILNVEDMDYHPLLKQYQLTDATRTDKEDKYFGR